MLMDNYKFFSKEEFQGKRVVVTGGTEGQGKAIVERMILGGAKVLTTARHEKSDVPSDVIFVTADLSTTEGCNKVIAEIFSRLGGIDILINVVGGSSAPSGGFIVLTD